MNATANSNQTPTPSREKNQVKLTGINDWTVIAIGGKCTQDVAYWIEEYEYANYSIIGKYIIKNKKTWFTFVRILCILKEFMAQLQLRIAMEIYLYSTNYFL